MHLGNDHPLGPIDHKGPFVGHQRNIAHIDVLLFDVFNGLRARIFVRLKRDQAQLDLQRSRISQIALDTFIHVKFGGLKLKGHIFEHSALLKILDRKHRFKNRLNALIPAQFLRHVFLKELIVRTFLNLNQVRHGHCLGNLAERFTNTLLACERLSHRSSLLVVPRDHPAGAGRTGCRMIAC